MGGWRRRVEVVSVSVILKRRSMAERNDSSGSSLLLMRSS